MAAVTHWRMTLSSLYAGTTIDTLGGSEAAAVAGRAGSGDITTNLAKAPALWRRGGHPALG
ncbi:hypothetical protein SAT01_12260 [Sinomonas atrocyanea]|nr:hypothetical protein SAT01_12260 [Sinomonas atrocyanea]GGG74397.1 hypothetical protein GCM10007172_28910 [Sinomonas atrocyanea]